MYLTTLQFSCVNLLLSLSLFIMKMRLFAYILSFIVIALTVYPCIDGHKANSFQKYEINQSTNNKELPSEADNCSPFCICQCCQSSFFVSNIIGSSLSIEFEIMYNEYSPRFQSPELFDFLIPPKS